MNPITTGTNPGPESFGKGDPVVLPRGLSCRGNITKAVRKHYTFA